MRAKVKGDLFLETFSYLEKKRGEMGIKRLDLHPEDYKPAKWYPLSEYCQMLEDIYLKLMDETPSRFYRMGYNMIVEDPRWQSVFQEKHPRDVFSSTKRQKEQYVVGSFESVLEDEGHMRLEVSMYTDAELCTELWCESYHGRIQGVLDLTGYEGDIEKDIDFSGEHPLCVYEIYWEE